MKEKSLEQAFYRNVLAFPNNTVYRYVEDGENDIKEIKFAELYENASKIASFLQKNGKRGDRVLLLFPPGLDFCNAFWACIISGFVAVPVPLSTNINAIKDYLHHLQNDCDAQFLLVNSPILPIVEYQKTLDKNLVLPEIIKCADELILQENNFEKVEIKSNNFAVLQYTSGSVSKPKGVILTHKNIIENLLAINRFSNVFEMKQGVTWLPHFHDMGLIGTFIIVAVAPKPGPLTFMSPLVFIEKPLRWLKLMSDLKGEISVAPNFAFELCTKAISDEELEGLDFSNWKIALCGSESIKNSVVEAFIKKYEKFGFKRSAIVPCYGLAEATLLVTAKKLGEQYKILRLSKSALEANKVEEATSNFTEIVSCGIQDEIAIVKIVDPKNTDTVLEENEIGEILISGLSVSQGYYNKSDEINAVFKTKIYNDETNYFQTGDLGFLKDKELYVTGRIKDLIIIRGKNYYPQDIETAIYNNNDIVRKGCVAAFAINVNNQEKLAIVAEVKRQVENPDFNLMIADIKKIVSKHFGIAATKICIIKPNTLPKTTSGKLQRNKTRQFAENGKLKILQEFNMAVETKNELNNEEIADFIKQEIKLLTAGNINDLDNDTSLFDLGIESVHLPQLLDKLRKKTNKRINIENWILEPTINNLLIHLEKNEDETKQFENVKIADIQTKTKDTEGSDFVLPDFSKLD